MDQRPAAARPSFDLAWLRVLVTIALAALAAALTVLAGPEPAAGAQARCLSLTPTVGATRSAPAAPSVAGSRQTGAAARDERAMHAGGAGRAS